MTHICHEVRINGPIELVFDLVTTTRSWPQWHPATEAVSGVTDRPLALGDQVHERAVIGGRVHEGTWTVTEHVRPSRLVLQIDGGRIQITYTFSSDGEATLLRRELRYPPQDFAGGTADPAALDARVHAQSEAALRRLAWLVEHQLLLERNKRVSRGILEPAFNQADLTAIDAGFTPDAAIHDPGTDFRGPAQLRAGLASLLAAFPDFRFTVLDQLAEGDRVLIRYRGQGTQRGDFLGIPATGRRIDYTGMFLVRVEGAQIAEVWAQPDQLGIVRQLGASLSTVEHTEPTPLGGARRDEGATHAPPDRLQAAGAGGQSGGDAGPGVRGRDMAGFSLFIKFVARDGERDALVDCFMAAIASGRAIPGLEALTVHTGRDEPDTVWVNELWTSQAAFQAAQADPEVQALVQQVRALTVGAPEVTQATPVGARQWQPGGPPHAPPTGA
jgi:predicted ester cyclase/quinol monooxygenase YgiN/uncharacterized protein YndB with AHSA1/START domain